CRRARPAFPPSATMPSAGAASPPPPASIRTPSPASMDWACTDMERREHYPVWDLPTRLSHWAIALLVLAQFGSGLFGILPMDSHLWCGYALLVALLFRILWGFVGSRSARFSHFLRGPGAVAAYARTLFSPQPSRWPGHNPLGGWSIVLMLALALAQCVTGLFTGAIDLSG